MKKFNTLCYPLVLAGLIVALFIRDANVDIRLDKLAAQQVTTSAQIDTLWMLTNLGADYVLLDARSDRWGDSLAQARIDSIVFQNGKDRDYLKVRIDYAWDWIQRQAKQRGSVP